MARDGARNPLHPRNVEAAVRRARAVDLRASGATYQQIADTLGYDSKGTAHAAVTQGLAELGRESAEELLAIELATLNRMQMPAFARAKQGDDQAISSVLKIMDRRAKLVGLDDYEARMASVAEQNSATLNLHVSWMQDVIMRTLQGLNLTDEQWAIVPGVVVEALEALPASPNEGPTDGTQDHSRP